MAGPKNKARRRLFIATALVGGGLLVGYALRGRDRVARVPAFARGGEALELNGWVKIAPDGTVTVAVSHQEMGQGVYTALPMLVAEELDADWSKVRAEQAPVDKVYGNMVVLGDSLPVDPDDTGALATALRWVAHKASELLGLMVTGGSTSSRDAWTPMRVAGASAREMLVTIAARRWNVAPGECFTDAGYVLRRGSGDRLGYGELAAEAAQLEPPRRPRLKPRAEYKLIGTPAPRLDLPAKVNGSAQFGIDVRLPGMLYAAIKQCPVLGGKLGAYDDTKARAMPGFKAVVPLANAVAVVADSWWRATRALDTLGINWDEGKHAGLDTTAIFAQYGRDMEHGKATTYADRGDAAAALTRAGKVLEAEYRAPLLAHATMEPMNCTARFGDGRCEVWAPNQSPTLVQWIASRAAGLDMASVAVHTTYLGGGFGRRAEMDYVTQAVTVAKNVPGAPVKLVWSREEDMQHDMYRPAAIAKFRAALDGAHAPLAWWNRIVGPSVTRSFMDRTLPWGGMDFPPDKTNAEGAADLPYEFANFHVEHVLSKTPVPVGFWRSVGHSYNAFFTECFLDELAEAAGQDPFQFRRALLGRHPRHLRVLATAAGKAGWGTPPASGIGRGIALHGSFRSIVAQVAEVSVSAKGELRVHRVVCAVDCGATINPDTIAAQMESAVVFGLTAALHGEITLAKGRVQQANFPDYRMVGLADMPRVETHVVESGAALGGIGEVGTPPIAPAVVNAIFAATGKRVRSLPIRASELART
jgi:isoquinoline 1-oxidoreductase beta subunit